MYVFLGKSKTDNRPQKQELTIPELHSLLTTPRVSTQKDGPYILTAILGNDGRRLEKNVEAVCGFFLDFDKGIDEFTIKKTLAGLAYIAHTTHSHTAEKPRWRVYLPYERPLEPRYHKRVYQHMLKLFSGYEIDKRCKTLAQLWYLPTCSDAATFRTFDTEGERYLDPTQLGALPEAPTPSAPGPRVVGPGIPVGARDETFFKMARDLAMAGLTEDEAYGALRVTFEQYTAENPTDPFTLRDVRAKVKSAYRKDYTKGARVRSTETQTEDGTFATISADKLSKKRFPALQWAVEGLLPEGVAILGARPKVGKTRLAFNLAIAIASGQKALGHFSTEQSEVLYIAADEKSYRLVADRIKSFKLGAPKFLHVCAEQTPLLGEGFEEHLHKWMALHPHTGLIVIDTYIKVKPPKKRGEDGYEHDTAYISGLQAVAREYRNAILLVHHDRKAESSEWADSFLGSTGIGGTPDTLLGLRRSRGADVASERDMGATLHVTGRDIREADWGLLLDDGTGAWSCLGAAGAVRSTQAKDEVWGVLQKLGRPASARELADFTGKSSNTMRRQLLRMERAGEVKRKHDGSTILYYIGYVADV